MDMFVPESDPAPSTSHNAESRENLQPVSWGAVGIVVLAVIVSIVALDQMTKAVIVDWIGPGSSESRINLLGTWLAFEYVQNTGAAFGILKGRTWLLSVLALLVASGFVAMFWKHLPYDRLLRFSVALVIGGAIGNLVDRVRLGYVVDFVAVGTLPRFNLADSAITIGLVLLAWTVLRYDGQQENEQE
jgi:signal peptidase II